MALLFMGSPAPTYMMNDIVPHWQTDEDVKSDVASRCRFQVVASPESLLSACWEHHTVAAHSDVVRLRTSMRRVHLYTERL